MFKNKHPKTDYIKISLADLRRYSRKSDQCIELYQVVGIAPTYTYPATRKTYGKVTMNWWVYKSVPFRVNYENILGKKYSDGDMIAVNQLFLLEEAKLFKKWIDDLYPEENTKIIKVEYPAKKLRCHTLGFDGVKGSLWNGHPFWHYAMQICYYIDLTKCKKLN